MEHKEHKIEDEKKDSHEERISETHKKKENIFHKKNKEDLTKKIRENPWIVSTIVLGILVLILLIGSSGGITGKAITKGKAGQIILDLANSKVGGAELIEVNEKNGLYEVVVSMDGKDVPIYLTLDGENLVTGLTPLSFLQQAQQPSQQTQQTSEEYSEGDLEKLRKFSSCLAEKGLKIYGANWCGWTKKLVMQTLGGFDIVGDVYIECTEETELCEKEGITGYPTIKLNGEPYQGERTLESLAETTGCSTPDIEIQSTSTEEASCS